MGLSWPVWQQIIQPPNPILKSVFLNHSWHQISQVRFPGSQTLRLTFACGRFIGRGSQHQYLQGSERSIFGHRKKLGCTADTTKVWANPPGSSGTRMTLKLPRIGARGLDLYRPLLTSHWMRTAPGSRHDVGQDVSFQPRTILGWPEWSGPQLWALSCQPS